jgi:Flp pilus assembly protein TadD
MANTLHPEDPSILNNLGYIKLTLGECAVATETLQKALELDGTESQYINNLAFSHICENNAQEALSLLRSTTSEDEARYNLGVGYEIQKNVEVAREHYQQALVINPNHYLAKDALTRLSLSLGIDEQQNTEEEL